jgi:glycosyltransferase involved in cell wall biosynthesis
MRREAVIAAIRSRLAIGSGVPAIGRGVRRPREPPATGFRATEGSLLRAIHDGPRRAGATVTGAPRRLRIAQVAPPLERVPPAAYGGTERIVHELTRELVRRGHDVTVFASGDSDVAPAKHVVTVPEALRPADSADDAGAWFAATADAVLRDADQFDVIHSHLEWWSLPLARASRVPVVSTFHGRLDLPSSRRLLEGAKEGVVAISRHQASVHPDVPWTVVHNGLSLRDMPFGRERSDAFCFVGRVDPEKGIVDAIDVALKAGRPLRIAAKLGVLPAQRAYDEEVFRPALERAGSSVEFLGELGPEDRDQLFAESYATLMPGAWPEPFGLVAIESLATGTPIVARRIGALPEIIREGIDGVFGDDITEMAFMSERIALLDRQAIRDRVIERFSTERMADRYEELYARMLGGQAPAVEAAAESDDQAGRLGPLRSTGTSDGPASRVAVGPGRGTTIVGRGTLGGH